MVSGERLRPEVGGKCLKAQGSGHKVQGADRCTPHHSLYSENVISVF
jgi:hypothetical protein